MLVAAPAAIVAATAAAAATTANAGFDHFANGPLHAHDNVRLRGARLGLGLRQSSSFGCLSAWANSGRAPAAAIIVTKPYDGGIGTTAFY